MLFNSLAFALFLPCVLGGYWLLFRSFRLQNIFLLATSYLFYGWWDWRYLFLIIGCSITCFLTAQWIAQTSSRNIQRIFLTLACVLCLGVLCVFKYYNFFIESFTALFACCGITWHPLTLQIMLPVGISFFTFQALSYTIDVYFKKTIPTKNLIEFLTFIAFFPQLVAGPIERSQHLLPQFQAPRRLSQTTVLHGCYLIVYGLFKKMVVADTLSHYVDQVYDKCTFYGAVPCLIAAFFFSIQIYCDFSGYSDVARGCAQLFGFKLMLNFDRPYLSQSFTQFWRRWHISLSTWFKDYVYIPLGGNRVSPLRTLRNLWIVFLLSGLWHGANWTFVAWGALHALFQTFSWIKNRLHPSTHPTRGLHALISILIVNIGVIFAWILFRAQTFHQAQTLLTTILTQFSAPSMMQLCAGLGPLHFVFCWLAVALLGISYLFPRDCRINSHPKGLLFMFIFITAIVFLGAPTGGEFIYFQF